MDDKDNTAGDIVSALMDGRLTDAELGRAFDLLGSSGQAVRTWHAYQVVGDVLRSAELAPVTDDLAFWTKLEAQLQTGGEMLAEDADIGVGLAANNSGVQESANAAAIRWKWFASAAMSALVIVVGAQVWTHIEPLHEGAAGQLAVAMPEQLPQVSTQDNEVLMIRDPALDALMAAHQQLGGHSALQGPNGFLRNATFERPLR
ncbi:MAG: sigma-E factor negative regulatory protein [Rhodoferax sp.]